MEFGKKGSKLLDATDKYLDKSIKQIWKGSYAGDETTLLGIVG
ncbi:hypothetical protein [uncultured Tyzzerella sp.]|nr:hypothetical protein [uncultured Tyzzerella sp.]